MSEERIDPNTADLEALQQLPGIGAGLAQRIINHRPYGSVEDLLTVPGLGGGTLERIRGRLRFEAAATDEPEAEPDETEASEVGAQRAGAPAAEQPGSPPAERGERGVPAHGDDQPMRRLGRLPGRSPGWWAALGLAAASVLCSVSLTLVVLLGINGTLDYGRHAAVRRVESRASQLESDLSAANSELNALRGRLEVIAGLSGRMTELEGRMDAAEQQLDRTAAALDAVQQQVDDLQQQGDRLDRIEAFFAGLQELLGQWFTEPGG